MDVNTYKQIMSILSSCMSRHKFYFLYLILCNESKNNDNWYWLNRSSGRSSFMFGNDMCRKDSPFGPNLQNEMQQLKRQLDFVNQKYENEKLKRGRYFTCHSWIRFYRTLESGGWILQCIYEKKAKSEYWEREKKGDGFW